MSPQLLLVLMVALVTASVTGLATRKPFYYLPLYWVLSVTGLLIGQVVGKALHAGILIVGQVELGAGLLVTAIMIIALHFAALWYNSPTS